MQPSASPNVASDGTSWDTVHMKTASCLCVQPCASQDAALTCTSWDTVGIQTDVQLLDVRGLVEQLFASCFDLTCQGSCLTLQANK